MSSDLSRAYGELRHAGKGHKGAVVELSRRLKVDAPTIERALQRAGGAARYARGRGGKPKGES
ncbi:MAG: hypothetical protein WA484_16035 [Solirubrobacteraceae bacterium]